jgi:hypothetical protein
MFCLTDVLYHISWFSRKEGRRITRAVLRFIYNCSFIFPWLGPRHFCKGFASHLDSTSRCLWPDSEYSCGLGVPCLRTVAVGGRINGELVAVWHLRLNTSACWAQKAQLTDFPTWRLVDLGSVLTVREGLSARNVGQTGGGAISAVEWKTKPTLSIRMTIIVQLWPVQEEWYVLVLLFTRVSRCTGVFTKVATLCAWNLLKLGMYVGTVS